MTLQESTDLNQMLSVKDLKAKHVNGENYLKVINLKKDLKNALVAQSEKEKQIFEDLQIDATSEAAWTADIKKTVWDKLTPCRKAFKFEAPEPFLTIEEFKEWTKEQDVAVVAILGEYLLKDLKKD